MPNSNLPPGTLPRDVDPPNLCPRCEGFGKIEVTVTKLIYPTIEDILLVTCPDCNGQGTINQHEK